MTVSALLRYSKTGQQATYTHEWPEGSGRRGVLWLWTEGNYACDCNRSIMLFGTEDESRHLPCSRGKPKIELLELSVDGRRFAACDMT